MDNRVHQQLMDVLGMTQNTNQIAYFCIFDVMVHRSYDKVSIYLYISLLIPYASHLEKSISKNQLLFYIYNEFAKVSNTIAQ